MTRPPVPVGPDAERMNHTRLRRRIMYGEWREDLHARMQLQIGTVRKEAWGEPDMTANVLRSVCVQYATLYDRGPQIVNPSASPDDVTLLETALATAGLWSLMQRVQRDTMGFREMLLTFEIDDETGEIAFRSVFPDLCMVENDPTDVTKHLMVAELRYRGDAWLWDVWDVRDPAAPSFTIRKNGRNGPDMTQRGDVTADYGGGMSGSAYLDVYSYLDEKGQPVPFVPYVTYHAANTGRQWDSWEWVEVVEATLNVGVLWSFWTHVVRDGSWPTRYALGVRLQGRQTEGHHEHTSRQAIVTDPATVTMLEQLANFEGQPLLGQWAPGGDPEVLARAIAGYERRVVTYIGLSPADVQRVSGDPRSGYALQITREAQREAQVRLEPTFARTDVQLLRCVAAMWNRWAEGAGKSTIPEKGWRARYKALPLTVEERRELREEVEWLLSKGYIDDVEAFRRIEAPDLTRAEAEAELARLGATSGGNDVDRRPDEPASDGPQNPPGRGDPEAPDGGGESGGAGGGDLDPEA